MKLRLLLSAVALAAPALMQSPASADVAIAVGTGAISPGVPTTGCVDGASFFIDGTAANLGTKYAAGPYTFHVGGNSNTCESIASGAGAATLSGDVSGTLTYSRTVGLITLSGNASVQGGPSGPITITCEVFVTSANPVTTYGVACAVQL